MTCECASGARGTADGIISARAVLRFPHADMVASKQAGPDSPDQADLDLFERAASPFTDAYPRILPADARLGGLRLQDLPETTSCRSDPVELTGTL